MIFAFFLLGLVTVLAFGLFLHRRCWPSLRDRRAERRGRLERATLIAVGGAIRRG